MNSYKDDLIYVATLDLPWSKMCDCNILVTGATGLIGGCLVEVLMSRQDKDYHVYASGRNEERAKKRFADFASDPSFHFVKYDVLEPFE